MTSSDFDPVLFISDGTPVPVDTATYPYVYNRYGHTYHLREPRGTLIQPSVDDPAENLGRRYDVVKAEPKTIGTGTSAYQITEFDFGVDVVEYEPLWATKETARAFGITLLHHDESLELTFDGLVACEYIYGAFAGYQSPYIGTARRRELLTVNATDLEFHAFPHLFCSQDSLPLVTSVARYRPMNREIHLADLWVKPGDVLYVPPKKFDQQCVDMHGNRNSARGTWGAEGKSALLTSTTLGNDEVFAAEATKPRYHEEKHPTVHVAPPGYSPSSGEWL